MLPSCHWHSGLSSLFQGPAERWRRQRSPSDGRMVVLRQFGLLLWKNYILQVGWHCALTGLPPSPLHVETAELAQGLDSPANLHQGPGASPGEKQICLFVWCHPAFVPRRGGLCAEMSLCPHVQAMPFTSSAVQPGVQLPFLVGQDNPRTLLCNSGFLEPSCYLASSGGANCCTAPVNPPGPRFFFPYYFLQPSETAFGGLKKN